VLSGLFVMQGFEKRERSKMSLMNRVFTIAALLTTLAVSEGVAVAQEIRYFVVQSTGLFEIRGTSTGGRFVIAPTSEQIQVSGRGTLPVRGYTDRAQRGETVVTQIRGSGTASVSVTFQPQGGTQQTVFAGTLPLSVVIPRTVSMSSNVDNLKVTVNQNGSIISRRLPIGSR
jgi:hypothetical protein